MVKIDKRKTTILEKKLAKTIEQLNNEIKKLPAHARRRNDEKNRRFFFIVLTVISLIGIASFGILGWLSVAMLPALSTLIITESGLFASFAIGLSARPLYNTYLWIRDLFSAEKIKIQNKDYDQCWQTLIELRTLALEKNDLSETIKRTLNEATTKYFPFVISDQGSASFKQLSLHEQIQRLQQEKERHPAYIRKKSDQPIFDKSLLCAIAISFVGLGLYTIAFAMLGAAPALMVLGPLLPFFLAHTLMVVLLAAGPITITSLLCTAYFSLRDLFSSAEIKAENKHCAQLEKTIDELKELAYKKIRLDEKINSKLKRDERCLAPPTGEQGNTEKLAESTENKIYVYKLFKKLTVPANEIAPVDTIIIKLVNT